MRPHKLNQYLIQNYKIEKTLKSSKRLKTFRGSHLLTNCQVEIQIVHKLQSFINNTLESFLESLLVIKELYHPQLLQLLSIQEDPKRYYVINEYSKKNTLFDFVETKGTLKSVESIGYFLYQLLKIFSYFHSKGFYHGNLNPNLILIDSKLNLKLHNFGFVCPNDSITKERQFKEGYLEHRFSPYFQKKRNLKLSSQSDIWSIGMCLYYSITGKIPFQKMTKNNLKLPQWVGKGLSQLFCRMIKCFSQKITIDELLSHKLFKGFKKKENANKNKNKNKNKKRGTKEKDEMLFQEIDPMIIQKMIELKYKPKSIIRDLVQKKYNKETTVYRILRLIHNNKNDFTCLDEEKFDSVQKLITKIQIHNRTKNRNIEENVISERQQRFVLYSSKMNSKDINILDREYGDSSANRNTDQLEDAQDCIIENQKPKKQNISTIDPLKRNFELNQINCKNDNHKSGNKHTNTGANDNRDITLGSDIEFNCVNNIELSTDDDSKIKTELNQETNDLQNLIYPNREKVNNQYLKMLQIFDKKQKKKTVYKKNNNRQVFTKIDPGKRKCKKQSNKKRHYQNKAVYSNKMKIIEKNYHNYLNTILTEQNKKPENLFSPLQLERIRRRSLNRNLQGYHHNQKKLFNRINDNSGNKYNTNCLDKNKDTKSPNKLLSQQIFNSTKYSRSLEYHHLNYSNNYIQNKSHFFTNQPQFNKVTELDINQILNTTISTRRRKDLCNRYLKAMKELGISFKKCKKFQYLCQAIYRNEKLKFKMLVVRLPTRKIVNRIKFIRIHCHLGSFYSLLKEIEDVVDFD
ncbi:mateRNAl embryonic leucine zipper kinase [Anaeramoeba flamelloides]|uniref:MateRNAl embryonic leucine zipper kinase n=1 Tax=Anaeramoeba flamelloides TaxID=1746091 RepID=A0ABQ8ZC16_9EUKA|nr:mateRNAl embryonic leucine zipper kinase [Anaeramoeba flamelloides]